MYTKIAQRVRVGRRACLPCVIYFFKISITIWIVWVIRRMIVEIINPTSSQLPEPFGCFLLIGYLLSGKVPCYIYYYTYKNKKVNRYLCRKENSNLAFYFCSRYCIKMQTLLY